jgi:hypothetical protein
MKKLLLATLPLLLSACHSITIPTPSGPATVTSFGQKTRISELSFSNGTLKLKGYNNDQVTGMVELFQAGVEQGKKSVIP